MHIIFLDRESTKLSLLDDLVSSIPFGGLDISALVELCTIFNVAKVSTNLRAVQYGFMKEIESLSFCDQWRMHFGAPTTTCRFTSLENLRITLDSTENFTFT